MGWVFSLALFCLACFSESKFDVNAMLIASALFAIAGSTSVIASAISDLKKDKDTKNEK